MAEGQENARGRLGINAVGVWRPINLCVGVR